MKKTLKIGLVLLIVLTMGLFARGAQEEGAEAEENKVLRIITWSGYAPQELIDKFTAETGIAVEVTLSNNEEMISKLRATRGGGFDLAQPSQDRISSVANCVVSSMNSESIRRILSNRPNILTP